MLLEAPKLYLVTWEEGPIHPEGLDPLISRANLQGEEVVYHLVSAVAAGCLLNRLEVKVEHQLAWKVRADHLVEAAGNHQFLPEEEVEYLVNLLRVEVECREVLL